MKIEFTTIGGTRFESNENQTYFYAIWTRNGEQIKKRVKKAEFFSAQRENEIERKAIAEAEAASLDAAAENDEISAEQFVELIEQAEESAETEEAKEIADLYCRRPEGTDLQKPAVLNQYGCVDCSKCNVQNCVHRDCMRRNPTSVGGLGLCPRRLTPVTSGYADDEHEGLHIHLTAEEEEELDKLVEKFDPKKAKKARKPRKSKNVSHISIAVPGLTLTAKQVDFIRHLSDTMFWEDGLGSTIWVDCLCDDILGQFADKPMTVGAMISTLCEKGLGTRATSRRDGRKCTSFALTEIGKLIAAELGLH